METYLQGTPYADWRRSAIFYAALHYVDAYFFGTTPPQRFSNHGDRNTAIELDGKINAIYKPYSSLEDSSRCSRYDGWKPSEEQIVKELKRDLAAIKKHLRSFVPKIKA